MSAKEPLIVPAAPVIIISGLHGVGKSTHSKLLSKLLGLKYISTGMIFRELANRMGMDLIELTKLSAEDRSIDKQIDDMSKQMLLQGGFIFDSMLASHLSVGMEALRIYLFAPIEVRVRRIAEREKRDLKEIWAETLLREKIEIQRFREYYKIDLNDISIYHIMLDTSLLPIEDNIKILLKTSGIYLRRKWPNWFQEMASGANSNFVRSRLHFD